jgi:hypothetical protein
MKHCITYLTPAAFLLGEDAVTPLLKERGKYTPIVRSMGGVRYNMRINTKITGS